MRSKLIAAGWTIALSVGSLSIGAVVIMPELTIAQQKVSEIDRAITEGTRFFREGSTESLRKAIGQFEKALGLARSAQAKDKQAVSLFALARLNNDVGEKSKAIDYYNQVLPILRTMGDRSGEAKTLNNIGLVYSDLGENQKALAYHNQALPIFQTVGNSSKERLQQQLGEARTLSYIGGVYSALGDKQKALKYYNQALPIFRTAGNRSGEARTLTNIGGIYSALGDKQKALEYYNQSLPLSCTVGDRSGEARTLINIGGVYSALGDKQKALAYYNQALPIFRAMGDSPEERMRQRSGEATTLNNIGGVYDASGDEQKALAYYNQALPIFRAVGNRSGEATTLNNIGGVYSALNEKQKALEYYNQALPIFRAVGNRSGEATTLNNIGYLLASQNQTQLAIVFYKQSVSIYESLRQDMRTLPKETQQTYIKTVEQTYRELADLLLKADRILEAQQVLDLLKVQELNTYLQNVRGASQPLENLPPETEILKKYNEIQTSAIVLGQELSTIRQTPEASRTPQQTDRIAKLTQIQEDLNQQFNQFTSRPDIQALLESLSPKVRRQTIDTADLNTLRANLKQLNAVMIYPLILDDRLELIITTPDAPPLRRTVNVKREDLNKTIVDFRTELNLNADPVEVKRHAQTLYNCLIKPLEDDLKTTNPKTLIYAPDGQLRYIPIGALHDGNQWLTERYAINIITAKSLTNLTQITTQQPRILAGAIGGKATDNLTINVGTRSFSFAGLPFTNAEIDAIQSLQPNTQALKEEQFTLAKLKPKLADYNILHLATHAAIVPVNPENSFILFGGNTTATLKDIENWTLSNFDLVVLSACETGLAGNYGASNGEEILGLGYQFQSRGAKATIASLWRVADDSTQHLMTEFYKALKSGQPKAQALQTAQRALISQKDPKNPNFNQPYHWASFILIGNGL